MPIRNHTIKDTTLAAHKHISREHQVATWLMSDGWEVLQPMLDHGMKTDLVIADDNHFYRIQIKCVDTADETIKVSNQWKNKRIDFVIYFSLKHHWGYIARAFTQNKKRLNSPDHIKFFQDSKNFLNAFKRI
jgi:Holliday junction resolvase-like predicted endonuclease